MFSSTEFTHFYNTVTSYPTIIFCILFALVTLYWLLTLFGFSGLDDIDMDMDIDVDGDVDIADLGILSGMLFRFGLYGVPLIFMLTIIICVALLISFMANVWLNEVFATGILRYVLGTGLFLGISVISMMITGQVIKPLRKTLTQNPQRTYTLLLSKVAMIRTSRVDDSFGEAVLCDKGADLILKVRNTTENLKQGDKVVLISYNKNDNTYNVISEQQFNQG